MIVGVHRVGGRRGVPGPPLHDPAPPADEAARDLGEGELGSRVPTRLGGDRRDRDRRARRASSTRWPTGSRRASRSSAATATAAATSWPTSRTSCGRRSPPCGRSTSCSARRPATTPTTRAEFLESSRQQLERLDWLAQNLLELSKLDSGLVLLDLRPDDLRAAVESAVEQAEPRPGGAASTLTLSPARRARSGSATIRSGSARSSRTSSATPSSSRRAAARSPSSVQPTADGGADRGPRHGVGIDAGRAAADLRALLPRLAGQRGARQRQRPRAGDREVDRRHARRADRRREPARRRDDVRRSPCRATRGPTARPGRRGMRHGGGAIRRPVARPRPPTETADARSTRHANSARILHRQRRRSTESNRGSDAAALTPSDATPSPLDRRRTLETPTR